MALLLQQPYRYDPFSQYIDTYFLVSFAPVNQMPRKYQRKVLRIRYDRSFDKQYDKPRQV